MMPNFDDFCRFAVVDAECRDELRAHLPYALPQIRNEQAAVLVGITRGQDGAHIVLTRRSEDLPHHAGQVSFPGGKIEAHDADAVAAALRETREEIGVGAQDIEVFGCLPMLATLTGFDIFPVLAGIGIDEYRADPAEVTEIFTIPAICAFDVAQYRTRARQHRGFTFTTLELPYRGYDIWGATAAILYRLAVSFQRFHLPAR